MENTYHSPYDHDELIDDYHATSRHSASICPRCKSNAVEFRNYATKAGCVIGAIAAVGVSIAGNWRGARIGTAIGPLGIVLGGVASLVLDALASGAAGCATGITMGQIIDRTILRDHKCHSCGHTFNAP